MGCKPMMIIGVVTFFVVGITFINQPDITLMGIAFAGGALFGKGYALSEIQKEN